MRSTFVPHQISISRLSATCSAPPCTIVDVNGVSQAGGAGYIVVTPLNRAGMNPSVIVAQSLLPRSATSSHATENEREARQSSDRLDLVIAVA